VSKNIYLTGFMGAGKSTVGRRLAKSIGYRFADLDQLIVAREGKPIPEIFASHGEAYFRDCETAVLADQVRAVDTVYATGGGIVARAENRALMKASGQVVYLRAGWTTLQQRLSRGSGRPLADPQKGWAPIRLLWESRLSWYEEADLVIDTDHLRHDAVVNAIVSRLGFEVAKR
jgi:shikimate kinase